MGGFSYFWNFFCVGVVVVVWVGDVRWRCVFDDRRRIFCCVVCVDFLSGRMQECGGGFSLLYVSL